MNTNTKTIIIVIILLVIIILSGSLTLYYLNKSAEKLQSTVMEVSDSVSKKQWTSADEELRDFEDDWEKTKYFWAMLVDHFEIDNIDDAFNKSKKYVETQDESSALAELESLRHYILHIPRKEGFTMENVL